MEVDEVETSQPKLLWGLQILGVAEMFESLS